jgi:hypothetical protein
MLHIESPPSVAAATFGATVPNAFKSDGERIHALIQSLDSAQNGELWLPIGTLLQSESSRVYASMYAGIFPDCARSAVH